MIKQWECKQLLLANLNNIKIHNKYIFINSNLCIDGYTSSDSDGYDIIVFGHIKDSTNKIKNDIIVYLYNNIPIKSIHTKLEFKGKCTELKKKNT